MTQDKGERPASLVRTLASGDKVTIGQISWDGWRLVKNRMLEAISASEIHQAITAVTRLFQSDDSLSEINGQAKVLDLLKDGELVKLVPPALSILNRALDNVTVDLIKHCIDGPQPERLYATDVGVLRDAIFRVNDFRELLESEKNSGTALVNQFVGAASDQQDDSATKTESA